MGTFTSQVIGKTDRGFDFLGCRFETDSLSVADQTIERFKERIARFYEQNASNARIGEYVNRWWAWVSSGLPERRVPGHQYDYCGVKVKLVSRMPVCAMYCIVPDTP